MLIIFKVPIEFTTTLFLFYILVFWPWGMWDPSFQPGIEPTPPALESEVSTTAPPGKSLDGGSLYQRTNWEIASTGHAIMHLQYKY